MVESNLKPSAVIVANVPHGFRRRLYSFENGRKLLKLGGAAHAAIFIVRCDP
jgi:hypothetical protein